MLCVYYFHFESFYISCLLTVLPCFGGTALIGRRPTIRPFICVLLTLPAHCFLSFELLYLLRFIILKLWTFVNRCIFSLFPQLRTSFSLLLDHWCLVLECRIFLRYDRVAFVIFLCFDTNIIIR